MTMQHHPFHLVFFSPWPLLTSFSVMSCLISSTFWITNKEFHVTSLSLVAIVFSCSQWWRDVSRESTFLGYHTNLVINGLRWGMILFITSEIFFFLSFFWTFFHSSLSPNFELGMLWPPLGLQAINPFQVPLLNTVVLLASGITVTLSHHYIIKKKSQQTSLYLVMTLLLGLYFTSLQGWEYWEASYSFSDSSFGSSFFLATGFHGLHVCVGSLFLFFCYLRHKMNMFSNTHHVGFEMAIWYWHFVDVVWLFLYAFLYWWSF